MSLCAVHPDRASIGTCPRCGRFGCAQCLARPPCPECRAILHQKVQPPPRWLVRVLGGLLTGYAVGIGGLSWIQAAIDFADIARRKAIFDGLFVAYLSVSSVLTLVWALLVVFFLIWYVAVLDWARGFGATTVSSGTAVAFWFVPFANFVHPYRTLAAVDRALGVNAGVAAWWGTFLGSLVLGTADATLQLLPQRSPIALTVASVAMSTAASWLCGRMIRRFTDFAVAEKSFTLPPAPG